MTGRGPDPSAIDPRASFAVPVCDVRDANEAVIRSKKRVAAPLFQSLHLPRNVQEKDVMELENKTIIVTAE
jgi:hypothetical protein